MAANGILLLRVSLGIVFLWFGALKFLPAYSPAEELAGATIAKLTFGLVEPKAAVGLLAVWETAIGLALVLGVHLRLALGLLFLQMAGTLTPLALFPSLTFSKFPFAPTMEGQYILKNLVLISAAIVIGATMRGGKLVAKPPRIGCCSREARMSLSAEAAADVVPMTQARNVVRRRQRTAARQRNQLRKPNPVTIA